MAKTINYKNYLIKSLRDPEEASAYLNVALEDYKKSGDLDAFLFVLRDVAEAQGGLSRLAQKSKLNRQNLYRVLSGKGNPTLSTLGNVLDCLGFNFFIQAKQI